MRRYLLAGFTVLLLTALAVPAIAANTGSDQNKVSYWCEAGQKFEPVNTPFIVPEPPAGYTWTKGVVKAGSGEGANEVYQPISVGQALSHNSGKDNSHIILCKEPVQVTTTTTTVPETTTTTVPETTTTTVPDTTTTTTVPDTTTTTVIDTTTTTVIDTTTTVPDTTTTVPETTTTVPEETTTTTQPEEEECEEGFVLNDEGECELPFTGPIDMLPWATAAFGLVGAGSLFVLAGRARRLEA